MTPTSTRHGISGALASLFIDSRLTPLIILATLLLGLLAILVTPREEEPQIVVPMADVFIPFPGASPKIVEEQLTKPLERKLSEIARVEYVYSISQPGGVLLIVRFYVGENMEDSLVNLYDKLMSNQDLFPPGAGPFMVKPRDINDVPIVTLTLSSERYTDFQLRRMGERVLEEIKKIPHTSGGFIVGGRDRELRVILDPARLKTYGMTPIGLAQVIQSENLELLSGQFENQNRVSLVQAGQFIRSVDDLASLVVGVHNDRPIYLNQVASITDGPTEPRSYTWFGLGPSSPLPEKDTLKGEWPAVTIAIAKQTGTNAVTVARDILRKVEALKGKLLPFDVQLTVTRNYGETANEKANELLWQLLSAIIAVVLLLGFVLGWRPALVVSISIPLTLALTLFTSMLIGYSINRVTLFALIFSLGILVDDAIVVVENILRHLRIRNLPHREVAISAVDEVGNPTILANLTFFAAILPMAFVSGLMGPYLRPIPVNASLAMLYSLLFAFVVIPWFCQTCHHQGVALPPGEGPGMEGQEGRSYRFYKRLLTPLISHRLIAWGVLCFVVFLLIAASMLFYTRDVLVKMLPFDNKSELQIVIDMAEGTTLEETARVAKALTGYLQKVPEVRDYQAYVGTASPFNFNGLIRHYFLRQKAHEADIQINLAPKGERTDQSHDIALRIRPDIQQIAQEYGANVKVVEVPPGPPVQAVLVGEVYGPDYHRQRTAAKEIRHLFHTTEGVVDVDDYIENDQVKYVFLVDRTKAAQAGIASEEIVKTLQMALGGMGVGLVHIEDEKSPVQIVLRLPVEERSSLEHFGELALKSQSGHMIPLSELLRVEQTIQEKAIYHKNQKPVVYVIGNVAGQEIGESPVYGVLNIGDRIENMELSHGGTIEQHYTAQPWAEDRLSMKWDGEWQITYETFRDMGLAFGVALLLMYLLIVGQFQSFLTPLIIMVPIPLTLIGILPGHWVTGSYFTATSMIGFIALAGIVVRNSILLVDFIQLQQAQGMAVQEAIIRAGAIRTRPILLTAGTLIVGAFAIVFDPIFEGLAISLLFGVGAATLLTLVVIPVLYFLLIGDRMNPSGPVASLPSGQVQRSAVSQN